MDVLALARPEHQDCGEGREAAKGVDDRRAGEIVETEVVEPTGTPLPRACYGVAKGHQDRGVEHEARQLDALGHSTGDDGRGGRGEHGLEDEVRPVGVICVLIGQVGYVVVKAYPALEGQHIGDEPIIARIHDVEAAQGVGEDAGRDDKEVLKEDVDRVLLPGQAGFERGKAQVHDEDQGCGHENPQVVHHEFGIGQGHGLEGFYGVEIPG